MSRLTSGERKELPDSDFAYIDREGGRHLPIENASHVRDAISRWPLTEFESHQAQEEARKKILEAAHKYGIQVSPTDFIVRDKHHPERI
ncbi:MAG TPA: DUF6582 domain-containing protein [Chloroflexota bacterium]|nr:DUF6582 domain-containing protein [Chloroflexota bacterium]